MSIRHAFRVLLFCTVFCLGSMTGAPIEPKQLQELLANLNQPRIAHTLRDESESDDEKDN